MHKYNVRPLCFPLGEFLWKQRIKHQHEISSIGNCTFDDRNQDQEFLIYNITKQEKKQNNVEQKMRYSNRISNIQIAGIKKRQISYKLLQKY